MNEQRISLPRLEARNPLGFLAAVGTLEVAWRFHPAVKLAWEGDLNPRAVISGVTTDALYASVAQDQRDVLDSPVLNWPKGRPEADLKVSAEKLRQWAAEVAGYVAEDASRDWVADLWCGLLSEDGLDIKGGSKPTHLHFTAGQQKFLVMVRELALTPRERFEEAWFGPWRMDSPAPVLGFDNREDRSFALRAYDPAGEKKTGIPGADWLAFRGLAMYPTATFQGRLRTRACDAGWKDSEFRWPVWKGKLGRNAAMSLLGDPRLVDRSGQVRHDNGFQLGQRGILRVYGAAIRRTDQGGYGSFGPSRVLAERIRDGWSTDLPPGHGRTPFPVMAGSRLAAP